MSVVSSRDLTRPGSRSSVATTMDSRPIYLLERCLAIRFEKASASLTGGANTNRQKKAPSRPPSSLSHLSNWLPWQKNGANGGNGRKTPSSSVSERNQMIREDCEDGLEDAQGDSKSKSSVVSLMTAGKPPMSPPPSSSVAGGGRQAAPPGWVYDGGFVLFQVTVSPFSLSRRQMKNTQSARGDESDGTINRDVIYRCWREGRSLPSMMNRLML